MQPELLRLESAWESCSPHHAQHRAARESIPALRTPTCPSAARFRRSLVVYAPCAISFWSVREVSFQVNIPSVGELLPRTRAAGIHDGGFEGIRRSFRSVSELGQSRRTATQHAAFLLLLTTKEKNVRFRALASTPVRLNPENPPNLSKPPS